MTELVVSTVADAGRIARVINDRSEGLEGVTEETTEGVARWFALPGVDPAADMRLAISADGSPEGYADVTGPEDGSPKAWVDLRVLAGHREALGLLLAWCETRGAERAGAEGTTQFFVSARDEPVRELLERAGYSVVRSSYEMERQLAGELESPVWPVGIEARPFEARHARAVHAALNEAFADHWGYTPESYERWQAFNLGPNEDTSLWRVAWAGDEVAGASINRQRRGEDESVGWVGVLGVRRPWRRRGLGEALLREALLSFAVCGKRSAGLGVDAGNTTGAVSLYERVGLRVIRRSDTWERRS